MPGWLGSQYSRQSWVEQAHSDMMVPCHLTLGDGKKPRQCSGMAIYRENVCKMPRGDEGAIVNAERDVKTVFASPNEFIEHHGKLGVVSSEMGIIGEDEDE